MNIFKKYYVQAIRIFEFNSFDTEIRKSTHAKIFYVVRKRRIFRKDSLIKSFDKVNDALDFCNNLNN